MQWEAFKPIDGKPVYTGRRVFAMLVAWWIDGDYAPAGHGWVDILVYNGSY